MKTIYYIPALVAGILSLASCNDNEPSSGGNSPAEAQSGINFNIGLEEASSRTEYSTADWLQIEWVAGQNPDLITIFCANTKHPKLTADKSDNRYYTDANWEGKDNAVYKVSSVIPYTHDVTLSDGTTQSVTTNSKAHITVNSTDPKDALYWNTVNEYYTFYAGYGEHFGMEFKNNAYTGVAVCRYTSYQELTQG